MNTDPVVGAHPGVRSFTPPGWPETVTVVATTRVGGVSAPPFASFNLAGHVGDDPAAVAENRRRLRAVLPSGCLPLWLEQVHGTQVVEVTRAQAQGGVAPQADASWTRAAGVACAVLTADCLPVLLTDEGGSVVAAVHAGWRGLAAGVIEAAVAAMAVSGEALRAWLGPAIGPAAFEVGPEVRETFLAAAREGDRDATGRCFRASARAGRHLADLRGLARLRLAALGVTRVTGDARCTHTDAEAFFSYRRDGQTGRMAFLVFRDAA